jgi:hypothetical protein
MRPNTIAALLFGLTSCTKPEPTPTATSESTSARVPEPAVVPPPASVARAPSPGWAPEVPLSALLAEYKDNEVRADASAKGKRIRTYGIVQEVKKDFEGAIYVSLGTGVDLEIPVLQCFIRKGQEADAAALSRGKPATVHATVDGLMVNVLAKDCVINPMMKVCRLMMAAVGGKRCTQNEKTGDYNGIIIETKQSGLLANGVWECAAATAKETSAEVYKSIVSARTTRTAKEREPGTFIGSESSLCYGLFGATMGGKSVPFPEDLKVKLQTFFDEL